MTAPDYRTAPQTEQSTGLSDDVREHGKEVGGHAKSAAVDVKDSATDRARDVAAEAKSQARDLIDESRTTLNNHANTQVSRLGETLQQLADELHRMARMGDDNGTAAPLVREIAERTQGVASHIQGRDATDLLDDIRRFARQRPGAFLAGAAGLGFLVGRLGRGLRDAPSDSDTYQSSWAGEPYPAHGYPTGPVGAQQPVGGMPVVGTDVGAGLGGGYATGATEDAYGTSGFGAGSSGYATGDTTLEGDATQVLPTTPGTGTPGTAGAVGMTGGIAGGTPGATEDSVGIDGLLEGDDRPEGSHYGA